MRFLIPKFNIRLCLLIILSHLSIQIFAENTTETSLETITWRILDWPPMYILQGPDEGAGLWDELSNLMIENLPEYEHIKLEMITPRVLAEMREFKQVIHPSVLWGTQYVAYSKANSIILPHRIIIRKGEEQRFGSEQVISLEGLLNNETLIGGISFGSYSEEINTIIDQFKGQKNLIEQQKYSNLVEMLLLKRLDYIIQYTPVISYIEKKLGKKGQTTSLAIEEVEEKYLRVFFAGPDNQWGRDLMAKINDIMADPKNKIRLNTIRLRWFDDKSQRLLNTYYDCCLINSERKDSVH